MSAGRDMPEREGSRLYREYVLKDGGPVGGLQRKVWAGNTWITDMYVGNDPNARERDMILWCKDQFGDESSPFGDEPIYRRWRRGNATVFGWGWFGFATEADMKAFEEAWPAPADVPSPSSEVT
jgi:hypothetical protein